METSNSSKKGKTINLHPGSEHVEKWEQIKAELSQELGLNVKQSFEFLIDFYLQNKKNKPVANKDDAAINRLHNFVCAIIRHNEQVDAIDRVYLSKKFMMVQNGSRLDVVDRYLEKFGALVEEHNKKYLLQQGLTDRHNMRYRDRKKYTESNGKLDFVQKILKEYNE